MRIFRIRSVDVMRMRMMRIIDRGTVTVTGKKGGGEEKERGR